LSGFVVRELCRTPSNWQSIEPLDFFLKKHSIVAIEGIDTRALTLRLRDKGALRAVLSTTDLDGRSLKAKARKSPSMVGLDLVRTVTCEKKYEWKSDATVSLHVVVFDYGAKFGIFRCLNALGCRVTVVPATTTAAETAALKPDGILLSNGPGDPAAVLYAIETIKRLLDTRVPVFGICLGHQLLGLALGGRTFKLKFGHHGSNHPVMDLSTRKVEVTSQNHGFVVDIDSIPKDEVEITHINLNDKTLEGLRHKKYPVFSVQYHPENSPGPHDSDYLFRRFREIIG
jgi:carbamoyl-phosphate synthase small subunit